MKSFPAQLKTDEHLIDVLVRLDDDTVEIRSGSTSLGRWARSECQFERHAPSSYHFLADGETVSMRVADDGGFRQALEYVRSERVPIVSRPLLVGGVAAIVAAIAFTLVGRAPEPAAAEVAPASIPTTAPTDPVRPSAPVTTPTTAPTSLVERWNAIAAGTPLRLDGAGHTTISAGLSVEVGARSVTVNAIPGSDPVQAERIVAALGLVVATVDPDLAPQERAWVLEQLGLDIDGANPEAIEAATVLGRVGYQLSYQPGERLVFSAGLER